MGKINPIALGACVAIAGISSTFFPIMSLAFFGIILAAGIMEARDAAPDDRATLAYPIGMFAVAAIRLAIWVLA